LLTLKKFKNWNDFDRVMNVLTVPATEIHEILNTDFNASVSTWINSVTSHLRNYVLQSI